MIAALINGPRAGETYPVTGTSDLQFAAAQTVNVAPPAMPVRAMPARFLDRYLFVGRSRTHPEVAYFEYGGQS
jgi:hypothetical protein